MSNSRPAEVFSRDKKGAPGVIERLLMALKRRGRLKVQLKARLTARS
jgi:hypothetical protein